MATDTYLAISDGTVSCVFFDGSGGATNYRVMHDAWAPRVSLVAASPLAGRSVYEAIVEELTISVKGTTAANCLANIATLQTLLEQAERNERGEAATAVTLRYSPKGGTVSSAAAPLQARILGRPSPGEPFLVLPQNWEIGLANKIVTGIRLRFMRQGEWLNPTAASTNASGNNGSGVNVTVANTKAWPPTKITISNVLAHPSLPAGYAILSDGGLLIGDANSYIDTATDYTTQADAGTNASGGNVRRFTPTATTERVSGASPSSLPSNATSLVFISARNNSATTSFRLRAWFEPIGGTGTPTPFASTPTITIPANATSPTWYPVGILPKMNTNATNCNFGVAITASAASGTLDIDKICLVAADYWFHVIKFYSTETPTSAIGPGTLTLDHRALTSPDPLTSINILNNIVVDGSPAIWTPAAPTYTGLIYCALLATGGYTAGTSIATNYWGQYNVGGAAVLSNTWTLERMEAYLIPQ